MSRGPEQDGLNETDPLHISHFCNTHYPIGRTLYKAFPHPGRRRKLTPRLRKLTHSATGTYALTGFSTYAILSYEKERVNRWLDEGRELFAT